MVMDPGARYIWAYAQVGRLAGTVRPLRQERGMTEAYVGRASGHLVDRVYEAPASFAVSGAVRYPTWMKALFVGGIILFVMSMVGLGLTPFVGNATTVTTFFATAAMGVAVLWVVAKLAPGLRGRA